MNVIGGEVRILQGPRGRVIQVRVHSPDLLGTTKAARQMTGSGIPGVYQIVRLTQKETVSTKGR